MKTLKNIILALLATALTVVVMPWLNSFGESATQPMDVIPVKTVRLDSHPLQAPPKPLQTPAPLRPQAGASRPAPYRELTAPAPQPRTTPAPQPDMPSYPLPPLKLPSGKLALDFPLAAPAQPAAAAGKAPTQMPPALVPGAPATPEGGEGRASGDIPDRTAPPAQTALAEKDIVTPRFPRNTAPVSGSVHLAFTVEADGTVSDVQVTFSDPQLSFKYRREAVRAARKSTYVPATRNGIPIPVRATRRIDFIIP